MKEKTDNKKGRNKNGKGSIRQKPNGKWEGRISVSINKQSVQKSVSGDTEREVKDKMELLKKFYEEKEKKYEYLKIKQSDIIVEEWIKIWVKEYKRLTVAESTLAGYISKINAYIRPYFKKYKLQEVTKNDVQLFVNNLSTHIGSQSKKELSIKTIKDTVKILKMIFEDACIEMDLIPFNPVQKPRLPKRPKSKKKDIMSITEQLQVTNFLLSEYNGIAYFTLFVLGVRASELSGFLWKDLDSILQGIHVQRGFQIVDIYDDNLEKVRSERKYTELKSEMSDRIIPVIPLLEKALRLYKQQIMNSLGITDESILDNESMFKTKNGTQLTSDYSITANVYSHVLRETQNSQMLKYNTYLTDTIQSSIEEVMKLTAETVKDPKLREKALENLKNTFGMFVDEKLKQKEEQLEQEELKQQSNTQIIEQQKNVKTVMILQAKPKKVIARKKNSLVSKVVNM